MSLGDRLSCGDGERKTLLMRQRAFEQLPPAPGSPALVQWMRSLWVVSYNQQGPSPPTIGEELPLRVYLASGYASESDEQVIYRKICCFASSFISDNNVALHRDFEVMPTF